MKIIQYYIVLGVFAFLITSCKKETKKDLLAVNTSMVQQKPVQPLSQEFKDYWYAGKAEISSYKLEQARYGEIREGTAVLIYVTEDFLPEIQVKADYQNKSNIPVLKLNATKNFNTGIYPYSIMQSTFYPVANNQHALKVSSSMQEWCGHVYAQLNNKEQFNIMSHSYFQAEADEQFKLNKTTLENELWAQLRINPKSLPTGNISVIPSFEYTRMKHVKIKAYQAEATLAENKYTLNYKNLDRTLAINFNPKFPYDIISWEETFKSGGKLLTTKATKLKTITSPYWQKNDNASAILRDTLQLN
ncbi:septum formation inhibitor Maf [Hyunsoonleella pacifica]|uniref:Septum formation inhibitor Maf n=1 Tax=Hyunsoonleella pacifica TaxID=1080224 RepID=A0A4Q9FSY0_9FLAO|nr:septum formation inhibitor Maf [Hyunsoonleella pacifica]TBN19113.1 septum formation inhibitor Maf [Hyunsoonleella pacifica]